MKKQASYQYRGTVLCVALLFLGVTDFARGDVTTMRQELNAIFLIQQEIADRTEDPNLRVLADTGIKNLDNVSDEEMFVLSGIEPAVRNLRMKFESLNLAIMQHSTPEKTTLSTLGPSVASSLTRSLSNAQYSDVPVFGTMDERPNATTYFAALELYYAAKLTRDLAGRACNQIVVVVVLGEGGGANTSLACTVFDTALDAALAVVENLDNIKEEVDGAEIKGVYDRAEDIFENVGEHDSDVKALLAEIYAKVEENGRKLDMLIELIQTPSGQRPAWPNKK